MSQGSLGGEIVCEGVITETPPQSPGVFAAATGVGGGGSGSRVQISTSDKTHYIYDQHKTTYSHEQK